MLREREIDAMNALAGNWPAPASRPGCKPTDYKDAVILREQGLTYKAIGDKLGVSRERIRQVLHAMGRSDLCHRPPLIDLPGCLNCGARVEARQRKFCSKKCGQEYRAKTPTEWQRRLIRIVFDERVNKNPPSRWVDIAQLIGMKAHKGTSIPSHFRKACRRAGVDPSPAFGRQARRKQ